eukprot:scaffold11733_cov158-Isochrysis_galbana.AAC.3
MYCSKRQCTGSSLGACAGCWRCLWGAWRVWRRRTTHASAVPPPWYVHLKSYRHNVPYGGEGTGEDRGYCSVEED